MFFALNQTLRWKILLLYYQWTESVQPGVLKRLFSANFQLSYFLWWTFFAALHNSKLKLILMYLIMAPLSPICFSHSDLFCTSPWSFSASYWWFCMFLWLFCVSLSVCGILHCIKVIFLTFWQKNIQERPAAHLVKAVSSLQRHGFNSTPGHLLPRSPYPPIIQDDR